MKKIFKLVIVATLTLCGCSNAKNPSDYYDLLKENNYQILASFDYNHFNKPGKKPMYLLINKNKEYTLTIYFDKYTKKPGQLHFSNEDGSYWVNFKEKTRMLVF